ncbi:putative potassium/sodium P-type ATPase [Pseudovirgaria hyperparasitica]|uniref:P-type Na(+) transporter n=1 Tax=Pseudovirgaria hyperparasitica TaxID=470096 RepID=A0A6A6VXK0_9PEZI|nr:putative potassium/sodium P-type ATPase [Pseudovirgaria hyperparasitica]KAF2753981.1 putative potassium/sodium P-type ATPase [Pseudovirgaria hyperparasitica]
MEEAGQLNVEESTEPPICGLHPAADKSDRNKNSHLQQETSKGADLPPKKRDYQSESIIGDWTEHYKLAHIYDSKRVAEALVVDIENGLSSAEAASRLARDGPNKVEGAGGLSLWKILLRQVSNSLTLVLVITMALSFAINDYIEGGVIAAVISLNIVVGFVQDYKAEKQIMSLRDMSAPISKVIRDGQTIEVKAELLVIGDIVQLNVGDIVPADLRLTSGLNVSTDESLLTGESLPVQKNPNLTLTEEELPLGDRTNMAYSASNMTAGRATGIVVSTGMRTEVGKIADLLRDEKVREDDSSAIDDAFRSFKDGLKTILGLVGTPLQIKLSKFALLLFGLAILLAIIVFSANVWDVSGEVLLYGICVAVAVIPESLIAVLTITMAVGTKAMAKGNVIVRKLSALEAVGGVTNICSDKTGTLTQGKMIARKAWIPRAGILTVHDTTDPFNPSDGHVKLNDTNLGTEKTPELSELTGIMTTISLCNLSQVYCMSEDSISSSIGPTEEWKAIGEPTEIALHVLALRLGYGKAPLLEKQDLKWYSEFSFDSTLKRMSVVYGSKTGVIKVHTKGAAEVILPLLDATEDMKAEIMSMAEKMAEEGLRVLCIAHRDLPLHSSTTQSYQREDVETQLSFAGLIGIYDPPRLETAGAVRKCQMAGISVHMLTGDHIKTATAIAYDVGILGPHMPSSSSGTAIMPAAHFDKLTEQEIDAMPSLPLVIARCSPTTKARVVEAMHRRGAYCVMTGDGVNDSPALKRSDVGIAMGLAGSDVAKDAADMVLTDDNFASIVKAVEEGRRLFDNIQKFLMHLLISNIAQVLLLLIGLAFKDSQGNSTFPLSPLEILWVNLVTSSFLAIGLGLEEAQLDVMYRAPQDLRIGVFTRELITDKFIYGFFMGSLCLVSFVSVAYGAGGGDLGHDCNDGYNATCDIVFRARSTTYATLTWLLLVTAWEVKHFSRSLFNLNPKLHAGPFSIFPTIWHNRFLFWAVMAGFAISFPVVYLPVVNREVFKHSGLTWEWGVVVACLVVYVALVESWKAVKRRFGIASGRNEVLTEADAEARAGLERTMTFSPTETIEKACSH